MAAARVLAAFAALLVLAAVPLAHGEQVTEIQGAPIIVIGADENKVTPLVAPVPPNRTVASPWPINPRTGQRYIGVKEFVIVLHDNVLDEAKELRNWCLVEYTQELETRSSQIKQKQAVETGNIGKCDADIAVAQGKITDIENSVSLMVKLIHRRRASLRRAQRKIDRIDSNWNTTISGYVSQLFTAKQALRDAKQIRSLLGVSTPPQVVGLLRDGATRASGSQVVSKTFKAAINQVSVSSDVMAIDSAMETLTKSLKDHIAHLTVAKFRSTHARYRHLTALRARVEPAAAKVVQLEKMVTASRLTVPDYEADIAAANQLKLEAQTRLQALDNDMQQLNDSMLPLAALCERETANLKARELLIEQLHQVMKQRLIDGSVPERIMLRSVDNILEPVGLSKTPWAAYYDVEQTNSPQPNYASLPLKQPPYSVDAQRPRHRKTRAPFGFPLPASVDPSSTASNLCAAFEFDEADGNPYAIDSSGYGHDGTLRHHSFARLKGGATGTGNALLFDGVQSYVDVGPLGNVSQSLGEFSVEFRIRTLDTHPALSSVLKVVDDETGAVLAIEPNGRVGKRLNNIWPVGQQATTDLDYEPGTTLVYLRDTKGRVLAGHVKAPYFDNRWHTLRWVVMNSTLNQMAFFMDGVLYPWLATIEQGPAEFAPSFKRNIFIGAGNNHGRAEGFFDGALDSFHMYCGKQVLQAFNPCCRVCNGSQACGDMCIATEAKCLIPVGCACPIPSDPPTPYPTEAPTFAPTASPSRIPEFPQWRRGESIVNEVSLFPGKGVLVPAQFGGASKGTLQAGTATNLRK